MTSGSKQVFLQRATAKSMIQVHLCLSSRSQSARALDRAKARNAVRQRNRHTAAAHVADFCGDTVTGARLGTDGRLALEGVELLHELRVLLHLYRRGNKGLSCDIS
jgi:hypothetical protein